MTPKSTIYTVLAIALVLGLAPATFADDVEGQVVQVQERVRTENGGELQQITVRTRQGTEMQLRLGAAGSCPDCVRVGDQIRARTMAGAQAGQAQEVRRMRVERTRSEYGFRRRSGDLLASPVPGNGAGDRDRDRTRARDGSGDGVPDRDRLRTRDRIHDPAVAGRCAAGAPGGGRGGRGGRGGGGG